MLANEGHSTDKIELRVIGGTWSYYPKSYQDKFIASCFSAANQAPFGKKSRMNGARLLLVSEQRKNETAQCRVVGISIETRPDYINESEIIRLRKLGVTRVELGVQSIYDDVLAKNRRGHKVGATILATRLLKDAGFKISYQVMLNLLGSNPAKDLAMAKELFLNQDFQPDLLKIYPLAILKEAPLYKLYKEGKYKPYPQKKLIAVIKEIKKNVPPWVRIERIIRDIPSPRIIAAKDISNLRQLIALDMAREGWQCKCIRCREIKGNYGGNEKPALVRRDYNASGGKEIFLSFENQSRTKIYSLLRLRIQGKNSQPISPILKETALIREIHTYGLQTPISQKGTAAQHKGFGKKLIQEAEIVAKNEFKLKKIASISGIGARLYWRKLGYKLQNSYMIKNL
jgi:elongator complex protein 3